jgi:eukaryotic-like serine/threonine-protein kinase
MPRRGPSRPTGGSSKSSGSAAPEHGEQPVDAAVITVERLSSEQVRASAETMAGAYIGAVEPRPAAESTPVLPPDAPENRYEDRGLIGRGGQGEVRRVYDRHVGRIIAMKVMSFGRLGHRPSHLRFWHEARVTANLDHPAIVPVHDMGHLSDERPYFTMTEVRGTTFESHIARLHRITNPRDLNTALRRLVSALMRASEGVAYAHSRRIVHRDIKPQNLMIGPFGEILVMDWGLALKLDEASVDPTPSWEPPAVDPAVHDSMPSLDPGVSRRGTITGTIAYMAPEQAWGERDEVGPWSDAYALGSVLYQVLSGDPPYTGTKQSALGALRTSPPRPLKSLPASPLRPEPLIQICRAAMARMRGDRLGDAGDFAAELGAWLDDVQRHERADAIVVEADKAWVDAETGVETLRAREAALRAQAARGLSDITTRAPLHRKKPIWALENRAERIARLAAVRTVEWQQTIRSALNEVADHDGANQRLADYYRAQLGHAEELRDEAAAARAEALLRIHDRGDHGEFLKGTATLSLRTDPPANVTLHRYVAKHRRLVLRRIGPMGMTPLVDVHLPPGSYMLVLNARGCQKVRYPVLMGRTGRWTAGPIESEPFTLRLPRHGELGRDDVFVAAGPVIVGGDPHANESLPRQVRWLHSFVAKRHPVTNGDYTAFLEALLAAGEDAAAETRAPKGPRVLGGQRQRSWSVDGGRVRLVTSDGRELDPRTPVTGIDWHDANAYAAWLSQRDKIEPAWRLPAEIEWEKVARGVDGRFLPWGDQFDPARCNVLDSHEGVAGAHPCNDDHAFRADRSPYGVRGLAGNVGDWCADPWSRFGPAPGKWLATAAPGFERSAIAKGGTWMLDKALARSASRSTGPWDALNAALGVRLVRHASVQRDSIVADLLRP